MTMRRWAGRIGPWMLLLAACSSDSSNADGTSSSGGGTSSSSSSSSGGASSSSGTTSSSGGASSSGTANPDDKDGDGVLDAKDNCPDVANANQVDLNGNKIGDACDGALKLLSDSLNIRNVGPEVDGKRYVLAQDAAHGKEMWSIAGATKAIALIEGVPGAAGILDDNGPQYSAALVRTDVALGKIWIITQSGANGQQKLWGLDTAAGTIAAKSNVNPRGGVFAMGGKTYLLGVFLPSGSGLGLYETEAPFAYKDISNGISGFDPSFVSSDGTSFLYRRWAYDAYAGISYYSGLWRTDASGSAPVQLSSLADVSGLGQTSKYSYFRHFVDYNGGGEQSAQIYRADASATSLTAVSSFTGKDRFIGGALRVGDAMYIDANDPDITVYQYTPGRNTALYEIHDDDTAITKVATIPTSINISTMSYEMFPLTATKFLIEAVEGAYSLTNTKLYTFDTTGGGLSSSIFTASTATLPLSPFAGGYVFVLDKKVYFTDGSTPVEVLAPADAKTVSIAAIGANRIYVAVVDNANASTLWRSDGKTTTNNVALLSGSPKPFYSAPANNAFVVTTVGDAAILGDGAGNVWLL